MLDRQVEEPFRQALGMSTSFRNEDAAKVLMGELDPVVQKALGELNQLIEIQKKASAAAIQSARVAGERLAYTIYGAAGVGAAARHPPRLGDHAQHHAARSANRSRWRGAWPRATSPRRSTRRGTTRPPSCCAALRDMNDGLGVHGERSIRTGAETIAVGAGQVAAGNQQLSSRTEEHASSLEETASTLEEFTTTVRQNAEHARQASALAGERLADRRARRRGGRQGGAAPCRR